MIRDHASGVRLFLQLQRQLSDQDRQLVETHLPKCWRELVYRHGQERVFNALRLNLTLGGAMFFLREGRTA